MKKQNKTKKQKKKQKQIKHTHTHTHARAKICAQNKIAHCSANLIYFVNVHTYFIPNKLPKKVKNLPVALQLIEIQYWSHNTAAHILLVFYYRPIARYPHFFKKKCVFTTESTWRCSLETISHKSIPFHCFCTLPFIFRLGYGSFSPISLSNHFNYL